MKFIGLIIIVLWLGGCSHAPKIQQTPTGLKPASFWTDQQKRLAETRQITGKLRLRYAGKKQNVAGLGRLLAQLPQQALLELRDPLGRVHYVAALDGKTFVAFYPTQKRAYVGSDGGIGYLRQFLGMEATFGELQRLLVGLAPATGKTTFDEWAWDAERGQYRGTIRGKSPELTFYVDANLGVLRELRVVSATDVITVFYADFEPCCGEVGRVGSTNIPVAQTVKVVMEKAETSVEVQWGDILKLEKPRSAEAFRISLPEEVQKISVP